MISQWISFLRKYFDINIKLTIDITFFVCHVIILCDRIKFKFIISINFNNWIVIAYYIKRDKPHHNEWCKLKFFINTCFSFTSICNWRLIINNINELLMKKYDVNDEWYILWMWIILVINFNQNFNLSVFMFNEKCFIFYFWKSIFWLM